MADVIAPSLHQKKFPPLARDLLQFHAPRKSDRATIQLHHTTAANAARKGGGEARKRSR